MCLFFFRKVTSSDYDTNLYPQVRFQFSNTEEYGVTPSLPLLPDQFWSVMLFPAGVQWMGRFKNYKYLIGMLKTTILCAYSFSEMLLQALIIFKELLLSLLTH